jgi:acylphosphatase
MVAGDKEQVDALLAWLQRGPPRAKVTEVVAERVTWQDHDGFNIT